VTTAILTDKIIVNVNLQSPDVSAGGFGVALIFDDSLTGTITNLTEAFVSKSDLGDTFDSTTKIYKCANSHYSQQNSISTVKVGRASTGDVDITESLDNLWDQDKGFFRLLATTKVEADIEEISGWCADKNIQFHTSVEPSSDKLDAADETDLISRIKAKSQANTTIHCHHQAGVDETTASITTAAPVGAAAAIATLTLVGHGLREFDNLTISGAADTPLNGNFVVLSVTDADNFTFSAKGAAAGADINNGAIVYFARYEFIEAALEGLQGGKPIGSTAWDFKTVIGQVAIPKTVLTDSEIKVLRDKKYIVYVEAANNLSITADGFTATGEQIKNIDVKFWLEANLAVAALNAKKNNEQIPYTDKGFGLVTTPLQGPMDTQISRQGINPLNDEEDYTISVASALDQLSADVAAGKMPAIQIVGRVGDVVLEIIVNVNLIR
jgi:hypothetical protein